MLVLLALNSEAQDSARVSGLIIDQSGAAHPWSHLDISDNPDNFQFAIVTDRTGGHRPGIFMDAIRKLNLLQPEFVMSVGDLIEGYTTDEDQIYREWEEFNGFIEQLDMPFFYVPGNHDYINPVMAGIWEELFGPGYYHFTYKDVLFLCLNTEEAMKGSGLGGIEKPQYEYVKKVLAENEDVRWTLVFMHQPLWLSDNTGYWDDIETLLAGREHTVFAGHYHHYVKHERNNGKYFILATTGGMSQLRGPDFGEFDHVVWTTMTKEGPIMANLLLQGIWDENVVTEDLQQIISDDYIQIEPAYVESDVYEGSVFRVRVINDENYPMGAALFFAAHDYLLPEVIEYQLHLPPNTVEILEIPINVRRPVKISRLDPIRIYSHAAYRLEDEREINLSSSFGILPIAVGKAGFTPNEIEVDGNLSDWEGFPYKVNSMSPITGDVSAYQGDFDASYEFAVSYDEDFLYIALSIWDDELATSRNGSIWSQDAVRLNIDARPLRESASGRGENSNEDYLNLDLTMPSTGRNSVAIYREAKLPAAVRVEGQKSIQGADIEIAVPLDYFIKMNGNDWKEFRLNLAYFDQDADGSRTILWWKPDWGSNDNYTGSGMFFKQE